MSALDKPTFEQIEAYVLDRLGAYERSAFEQRMATDPSLCAEVELERENILAIELGGMERMLKEVRGEHTVQREQGGGWTTWLKYAAVVAVLLGAAIWFTLSPNSSERVFAAHFTPDPGLPVAMGTTDSHAFNDAMVAYKLGHFEEARNKWSQLLMAEPTNDTLLYYIASASLNMEQLRNAIADFEAVANDPASGFNSKSKWYLFLAYIKQGNLEKAKAMSLDDDPVYGTRVRAIKAQL